MTRRPLLNLKKKKTRGKKLKTVVPVRAVEQKSRVENGKEKTRVALPIIYSPSDAIPHIQWLPPLPRIFSAATNSQRTHIQLQTTKLVIYLFIINNKKRWTHFFILYNLKADSIIWVEESCAVFSEGSEINIARI